METIMTTVLAGLFLFIITVCGHSLAHRICIHANLRPTRSSVVYLFGLGVYAVVLSVYSLPIPVTGIVLFILSTCVMLYFYLSLNLGSVTPSAHILASYEQNVIQTEKELIDLFTDDELIRKRLSDLEKANMIIQKENTYIVTPRGAAVVRIAGWYRTVFNRPLPE